MIIGSEYGKQDIVQDGLVSMNYDKGSKIALENMGRSIHYVPVEQSN